MKVLLIQSSLGTETENSFHVFPLGLSYLATAMINQHHEVKIVDLNFMDNLLQGIQASLQEYKPDIVGISFRNCDNQQKIKFIYYYQYFQQIVQHIKSEMPEIKIIAGGTGFSMYPEIIMHHNSLIDYGVVLEAEDIIVDLLENLDNPSQVKGIYYRKTNKIIFTGNALLPDFPSLPFPRRDLIDGAPYKALTYSHGIQTKRGCNLRCSYCNYPYLNGSKLRLRSASHICDEIESLIKDSKVNTFTFVDSVLNVPKGHAEDIMMEIIQRNLNIEWTAYMHIKGITEEFVDLALKSGCRHMLFSPDGISKEAIKGLQKNITFDEVTDIIKLFTRVKRFRQIGIAFSFFINPPGETFGGLVKTVWFYFYLNIYLYFKSRGKIQGWINWIRLEPHTKVYDDAIKEGTITNEIELLPKTFNKKQIKKFYYKHPKLNFWDDVLFPVIKIFEETKSFLLTVLKWVLSRIFHLG